LRKAVTLGSPRTGVIAHVHPETSISKQQTHQSGEPIKTVIKFRVAALYDVGESNPVPASGL